MDLKKIKSKKGFTLIELMVVIVIIGILVAIALPNFIAAQDRAKVSSVKANMHTVQTIVETYAVDWGGVYADTLTIAQTEGTTGKYWKDFKNPFLGTQGAGESYVGAALASAAGLTKGGMVGYEAVSTSGAKTKYFIYGSGKDSAAYLQDKGASFYLTNQ